MGGGEFLWPDLRLDGTSAIVWMILVILVTIFFPRRGKIANVITTTSVIPESSQAQDVSHLTLSLFYCDERGHIIQMLREGGKWRHRDLTVIAKAPPAISPTLTHHREGYTNVIIFQGKKRRLYELSGVGEQWKVTDLMSLTGARPIE